MLWIFILVDRITPISYGICGAGLVKVRKGIKFGNGWNSAVTHDLQVEQLCDFVGYACGYIGGGGGILSNTVQPMFNRIRIGETGPWIGPNRYYLVLRPAYGH